MRRAPSRLAALGERVTEVRQQAAQVEGEIQVWLWWIRLGATIFFPWMAMGQFSLARSGFWGQPSD